MIPQLLHKHCLKAAHPMKQSLGDNDYYNRSTKATTWGEMTMRESEDI